MSEYEVRINRFRIAAAGNFSCYPKGASRRPYSAIFCFFPIGTTTDNFNYNQKNEDRTFSTTANVYPVSAFQTGNAPIFKHQHRTQFSYQPIKFCLLFSLTISNSPLGQIVYICPPPGECGDLFSGPPGFFGINFSDPEIFFSARLTDYISPWAGNNAVAP